MEDRRILQKRLFRISLHRNARKTRGSDAQRLFEWALKNELVFEIAYEETMDRLASNQIQNGPIYSRGNDGSVLVENLSKLFSWLLIHGPEIMKVLQEIAELFGSDKSAVGWAEIENRFSTHATHLDPIEEQM